MARNGERPTSWWEASKRGFVQAALVGVVSLAVVGGLWLLARNAPSAGGLPVPTTAPTAVKTSDRFGVASFPTVPAIEGGIGTPATPDIDAMATPVS